LNKAFTLTQAVLSIAAASMCLGVVLTVRAIHAHLRQQHPAIWNKFGFPQGDPFWVKPTQERQAVSAQSKLRRFLNSGERKALRDERLEALLLRRRLLAVGATVFLLALFADVFVF
jgi:hypothetical protein